MICVTGAEPSTRLLAERLGAHARFPLQEARLDRLEALDDDAFALLAGRPGLVVTCRRREEGGGFRGSEHERAAVLRRALAGAPAYLDVELAADEELRRELFRARGATRLLTSSHRFEPAGPELLRELARALDAAPTDVTKLAVAVEDAAELEPLRALASERGAGRPAIRIGMGPAGIASRALYGRFGSPFTYVAAAGSQPVAPGQLDVATAETWRVARAAELGPLALLGGTAVLRSPGPRIYNRVFAARGLGFVYLPVVTARPLAALALLERLGFAGASVTMPAKEALVPHLSLLDPDARAAGAVNT
ncbi:MAG: type I 3-dehydroquinate dehydratase, partial [Polyangiaceae bacterium]|nr:type I 3-dehydroquinate dehydratase [Polyangiaceae bacterium]